jgi:hypothetical protein
MLPFDFSVDGSTQISAIAISPLDTMRWYVLTNNGYYFHSSDAGKTWTRSDSNEISGGHYFYGSTVIPSRFSQDRLWIGGSGYSNPGAFTSSDNGKSWTPIDSGLPKTLIYGMVTSNDEKFLFAATEIGPYVYSIEGKRWYDLAAIYGATAPDMLFWCVERVPRSNTIRFGTYGRGIWDLSVDTVDAKFSSVSDRSVPMASLGLVAVPSVSPGSTQLRFSLPHPADITLRIFDLTGRCVRHFTSHENEGSVSINWDGLSDGGAAVPSGFYTAIVTTAGNVDATKIEIVR